MYLVRNRGLDRLEGLKVVKPAQLDHPGALERFEREMRAAARLDHPNIVKAHHSPRLEGLLAFAMEFVHGTDLQKHVDDYGPLEIANACCYVSQVAEGLQHAQEHGTVHRDIKPKNLILSNDGRQVVKILDFGLAKAASENSPDGGLTGTGDILGTPDYIAPEQVASAATADIRADIYSLGCTLWFLLTGQPPFAGKQSAYAKMHAHSTEHPRPLNELRPDVPPELAEIAARMMAKSPEKRFQNPAEVAAALAPFFKAGIKPIRTGTSPVQPPETATSETASEKETALGQPGAPALAHLTPEMQEHAGMPDAGDRTPSMLEVVSDHHRPPGGEPGIGPRSLQSNIKMPSRKVWIGLAACLLLVGLFAAWAGGLFHVQTDEGILVIDVNVENPKVFVNGNQVTVKWGDGAKQAEIGVKSGERLVELRKEGYSVAAKKLMFKDGERTIFEARLEPAGPGTDRKVGPVEKQPDAAPSIQTAATAGIEGARAGEEREDNCLGMKFIWCPPGKFMMGSPDSEENRSFHEAQVSVKLTKGFWLGKYEVTQGDWKRLMETAPWTGKDRVNEGTDYPVTYVNWDEANKFLETLNRQERAAGRLPAGEKYTLPTEAQWEYACRAGSKTRFSFGDDDPALIDHDWFRSNALDIGEEYAHRVGRKKPNPWGLYDMHGNVCEWCLDKYGVHRTTLPGGNDPEVTVGWNLRMVRGGCWASESGGCRSAIRVPKRPFDAEGPCDGFRVARISFSAIKTTPMDHAASDLGPSEAKAETAKVPAHTAEGTRAGEERDDNGLKMKLVWCPPGEFTMGSPPSEVGREGGEDELKVTLTKGFWLGKTEVTQAEWRRLMETTPWKDKLHVKDGSGYPVTHVSWIDAKSFCQKLTEQERQAGYLPSDWEYSLPTESQWEYACRAGTVTRYSFGNDELQFDDYGWAYDPGESFAHQVGLKKPNPWGLLDMHGNVWEWCRDLYVHERPSGTSVNVTSDDSRRVIRGGGWGDTAIRSRSANRLGQSRESKEAHLGFRVALTSTSFLRPKETNGVGSSAGPKVETADDEIPPQRPERYRAGDERDDNGLKMKLVWCPPGEFTMGTPTFERDFGKDFRGDADQVSVTLTKGFWLGKYEVTQGEWRRVMGTAPWIGKDYVKEGADYPAPYLSWEDASEFLDKLTLQERTARRLPMGEKYSLPTESQWEYACRAGTKARYSFGSDFSALSDFGWFFNNAWEIGEKNAHQIGLKKANPWGLHDMHGNVKEWCLDGYRAKLAGGNDPEVTFKGSARMIRGGAFDGQAAACKSAFRDWNPPDFRNYFLGFRVARVSVPAIKTTSVDHDADNLGPSEAKAETTKAPALMVEGDRAGKERDDNGLSMKLIWCPPGQFIMGSPASEEGHSDNEEQVSVNLTKGFWVGKYEVTQGEWERVMGTVPWKGKKDVKEAPDYPATFVSWDEANEFLDKLTRGERAAGRLPEGEKYTLPTEAQWEYACRAGSKARYSYSFGNDRSALSDYGWWGGSYGNGNAESEKYAHRVGLKKPNRWELHDMHGNVREWCLDAYHAKMPGGDDPEVSSEDLVRISRGGSWWEVAIHCRSAYRNRDSPDNRYDSLGFRVARSSVK